VPVIVTNLGRDIAYVARREAEKVAQEAAEMARAAAPKKSGHLANSIAVEDTGDGFKVIARAGYAAEVEYGTAEMQPEPFMQPAKGWADSVLPARVCGGSQRIARGMTWAH